MRCNCCGNDLKIYDLYCGKCGNKRDFIKDTVEEDERKFGIHWEYYSGNCDSYSITTRFTCLDDVIYGKYENALVSITPNGESTWHKLEKAELIDGYSNSIFATDAGVFVNTGFEKYALYDFDGTWLYDFDLKQDGNIILKTYIYGDTVYGLYKGDGESVFADELKIVAYSYGEKSSKEIWSFSEKNDLLEYVGLIEIQNRANGNNYITEPVPKEISRQDYSYLYVDTGKFAVNSRRIVLELELQFESEFTSGTRTFLMSIDKNTGASELILSYEHGYGVMSDSRKIAYLDMLKEYVWIGGDEGEKLCLKKYSLNNYIDLDAMEPEGVFEAEGIHSGMSSYFDGENYYTVLSYNIEGADSEGNVSAWESHGYGDATMMIVLGNVLYERHGAFTNSSATDWNFYRKQCTMEKVFSISEKTLESEYDKLMNDESVDATREPEYVEPEQAEVTEEPKKVPKFCMYCGESIVPGAKFCAFCGSKLNV